MFSGIEQVDYGQYAVALGMGAGLLSDLKAVFQDDAGKWYYMAILVQMGGCRDLCDIGTLWKESYMHLLNPEIDLAPVSVSHAAWMEKAVPFERKLVDRCSGKIAIRCLRHYKSEEILKLVANATTPVIDEDAFPSDQETVMMAYDAKTGMPLMVEIRQDESLENFQSGVLEHLGVLFGSVSGKTFIVDEEFYDDGILHLLSSNGNKFVTVMPVTRFYELMSDKKPSDGSCRSLGWHEFGTGEVRLCLLDQQDSTTKPLDNTEEVGVSLGERLVAYAREMAFRTNAGYGPLQICAEYGNSLEAGECYNFFRDMVEDKASLYQREARSFVLLLSCIIRKRMADAVSSMGMSFESAISEMRMVKLQKAFGKWVTVNMTEDRLQKLKAFHADPASDLEALDGPLWKKTKKS